MKIRNTIANQRWFYYLCGFSTLIFFSLIFAYIFSANSLYLSYFILGFLWNYTLLTPEIDEKIDSYKYRFSFLKILRWLTVFYKKIQNLPSKWEPTLRNIAPLIFLYLLVYLSAAGWTIYPIAGLVIFEIFHYLFSRFSFRIFSN